MHRLTSRLALVAAILLTVLIGLGCTGQVGPPVRPLGETQVRMQSSAFVADVNSNMNLAHQKYGDKMIELTGKLLSISNRNGEPYFFLEGPDPNKPDNAVCQMAGSNPWTKATPGQVVTIKGRGTSRYFVPRIEDCEVVSVTGDPAPRLSAEEFARRTSDPDLGNLKAKSRYLIVHGKIETIDPKWSGVFLQTGIENRALIHFDPDEYQRLGVASWKPGTEIEVIGGDSSNPRGWGWLVGCILMREPKE